MSDEKLDQILSELASQRAAIEGLTERVGAQGETIKGLTERVGVQGESIKGLTVRLGGLEDAQSKNLAVTAAGFEGVNDRLDNMQTELGLVRGELQLVRSEASQFRKEHAGGYRALNDSLTRIAERVGILEKV